MAKNTYATVGGLHAII